MSDTFNGNGNGNSFGGSSIYYIEEIDLSRFDTKNITNMGSMFKNIGELKRLNVSNFNTEHVTNMKFMFWYSRSIEELDVSSFDTSSVEDMQYMFADCQQLTKLNLGDSFNVGNVINMSSMFYESRKLTELDLSKFNTEKVEYMTAMFQSCSSLTSLDLSNFDTSNVTNMEGMFSGCNSLTSLDLSNFDTSNVTYMRRMFSGCSSLTSLDLSNFDTSNVTYMRSMFSGCSSLTSLDLSNFDTSNVTDMEGMFFDCSSLTSLDLSNFDTSDVTNMASMFSGCISLTSLDLSNFDTSNVNSCSPSWGHYSGSYGMSGMFANCSNLRKLILGDKFDTSQVIDMSYMFDGCSMLMDIIGISDFDISSVKHVEHMFDGCNFKNEINFRSWQPTKVSYMYGMYKDCFGHGDLYLDSFDAGNVDIKYGLVNGEKDYGAEGIFRNSHNLLYLDLSSFNLNHLDRNNSYDNIFAIDDEEGRQDPLLITTNDEFLTELTTLRNNCQNRTLFTTTLKVDGENVQFKGGDESEFVKYNGDKTEKYINLYESFVTTDTKLEKEKQNLIVVPGYENLEWEPEKETEGKVSYSLQNVYTIKKLEPEERNYGWSTIESSGGGSSSSSTNQDLISKNESTDTKTQAPTKSKIPEKLQMRRYLKGYDDEKIKPENCVTNAEFATVIYRLMNDGEQINYDKLKDLGVEKSDWFAKAVAYLIDDSRQIIKVTDEKFNPNKNITGYEMLNIIHNVLKFYGVDKDFAVDQDLNSYVTRAEMTQIIFTAFERKNNPGKQKYSDLDNKHWAYNFLMDALE